MAKYNKLLKKDNISFKRWLIYSISLILMIFLTSCANLNTKNISASNNRLGSKKEISKKASKKNSDIFSFSELSNLSSNSSGLTASWHPQYKVGDIQLAEGSNGRPKIKVGADIVSKNGPVTLSQVIKTLAQLKGMNVSWASDVNQKALVDVDIKANDDFWNALDNVLRQLDYYYIYKNNTIIVRYKETKRFYLPMPFLSSTYNSSVGGDLLGGDKTNSGIMKGNLSLEYSSKSMDIWDTIAKNLNEILQLGVTQGSEEENSTVTTTKNTNNKTKSKNNNTTNTKSRIISSSNNRGFFYTIDKPLGIITVTAPRSILTQVSAYIKALKKELYKEVTIEAKIIEVQLNKDSQTGIDWSNLLSNSGISGHIYFGVSDNATGSGIVYPTKGVKFISKVSLDTKNFQIFLNALKSYGNVKVLSNPKITLLNGQPAMLTVGESVRYIDKVTSTIDTEHGIVTYDVDTKSILSGLGLGVVACIGSNGEVVLHLTPVTSKLEEPIEYKQFGSSGSENTVGLPRIFLREMTTTARVKSGQVLVIGGLIDDQSGQNQNKVPILGDIPILGYLFKHIHRYTNKRELIILLKPQIVSM